MNKKWFNDFSRLVTWTSLYGCRKLLNFKTLSLFLTQSFSFFSVKIWTKLTLSPHYDDVLSICMQQQRQSKKTVSTMTIRWQKWQVLWAKSQAWLPFQNHRRVRVMAHRGEMSRRNWMHFDVVSLKFPLFLFSLILKMIMEFPGH